MAWRPVLPGDWRDWRIGRLAKYRHNNQLCLDCGIDTMATDEYYMVLDDVWLKGVPDGQGMLCIGCLEKRLGRQLVASDFIAAPINLGFFPRSRRFLDRLGSR